MKKLIGGLAVATLLSFSLLPGVSAQNSWDYVQAGQTLTQDFNGLPSSGSFAWVGKGPHFLGGVPINASALPGWMAWQLGGSATNAIFGITTGSATASGVYSVGSSGSNERALGCLASSTGIYAIGTKLVNQSGQTLQEIVVELTAEQWRKGGSGNANRWVCKMATGQPGEEALAQWKEVSALALRSLHSSTGAVTLNGQLAENKQVLSAQITQVGWLPGNWLMLRWEDMDEAGSDDIMAIDQFRITAHPGSVPLPTVDSLVALSPSPTRADTVAYGIQFNGNVLGLNIQHFSLVAQGLSGAHLAHLTGEGKSYQASIVTGSGQGYLVLGLAQAAGILPGLQGLPFWSFDTVWVDKKGPVIRAASWENKIYRKGDTARIQVVHESEPSALVLVSGQWDQEKIVRTVSINDTTTECWAIVADSGVDRHAAAALSLHLQLADALGNKSLAWESMVDQDKDRIDRLSPQLLGITCGPKKKLGLGDTLALSLRFSEPVALDSVASSNRFLPVTIGNRIKNLSIQDWGYADSLRFQYVLQTGETDRDGLRLASTFQAKNWRFQDRSGQGISPSLSLSCLAEMTTDGKAPVFEQAQDTLLWICPKDSLPMASELLRVSQPDVGDTLRWTWLYKGQHLGMDTVTVRSTMATAKPQAMNWPQAFLQENNSDSLWAILDDGTQQVMKKITFKKSSLQVHDTVRLSYSLCAPQQITGLLVPSLGAGQMATWDWRLDNSQAVYQKADSIFVSSTLVGQRGFKKGLGAFWLRQSTSDGPCVVNTPPLFVPAQLNKTWTGQSDSLFSHPKNWCEEDMPLAHHTVFVPAGTAHQPVIDFPTSLAGLVLSPSAQLTLHSSLVLTDTLSAAPSSIAATQGKFIWQGSKDLGLDGRIFGTKGLGELVLSNNGKVVLTDTLLLNKGLSLHQGKLETNALLQLKKGAKVFPAGPSAMLDGFAHVEFSLSPFNQTSAWVGLPFSHFFNSENFSTVVSQASSFALPTDTNGLAMDSASLVLTKTSPWLSPQSLFLKQTPTSLPNTPTSPATPHFPSLWLSGQLNLGNLSLTLPKKPVATGVWLKNPYLHEVNLAKLGGYARPWIWVWDPSGGQEGMFRLLSTASTYRLSSFESFLVLSPKEQDENLVWTESAKWLDTDKIDAATELTGSPHSFSIEWYTNGQLQDRAYAFDHPQSASRVDSLDAPKPTQPGTNLFFWSTDGKKLAADVRRWTPSTTLDLGFSHTTRGEHLLKIQDAHLPKDRPWVVFDRYQLRSFPVLTDSSYVFQVNNDSLSRDPHRFLVTSALRLPQAERLGRDFSVKLYPNPVQTEVYMEWAADDSQNLLVEILGSSGLVLKRFTTGTVKQGRFKIPLNHLGPGAYFLRVQGGEHQKTIRFLKAN